MELLLIAYNILDQIIISLEWFAPSIANSIFVTNKCIISGLYYYYKRCIVRLNIYIQQ